MTDRLFPTTAAGDIVMLAAATAAAFPPIEYALVPSAWVSGGRSVGAFDVEVFAAAAVELTVATLYAAVVETGVIADDDFTADNATETFTAVAHGLLTGDGPIRLTSSGTLPAGLATATDYYVIRTGANTFKLATSFANALAGTNLAITDDGTGTHTLADTSSTKLVRWESLGLLNGGTISIASVRGGARVRVAHNPKVLAYGVSATFGGAVATTFKISPVYSS
jgi:hypothetical protein